MEEISRQRSNMPELIPAGMLGEFAYCPRQCYIRWTEGEFVECEDAAEGNQSDSRPRPLESRSVYLSGPGLGVTCRLNLLEGDGRSAIPVEYKKGEAPNIPGELYESDRVKLCAQGLVLRENGFLCDEGLAYFAKSRKPVPVKFDESLIQRTKEIIAQIRQMISEAKMPSPLVDSPKCDRCSFGGICLPDEVNFLRENNESENQSEKPKKELRMLLPARDDRVPIYVLDQGCSIHKRGDCLEIRSSEGKISSARIIEISQVCLYGGVEISTPAVVELMQRGIPVLHFTHGGTV
jgi:CRISP-associated protein Cas1